MRLLVAAAAGALVAYAVALWVLFRVFELAWSEPND